MSSFYARVAEFSQESLGILLCRHKFISCLHCVFLLYAPYRICSVLVPSGPAHPKRRGLFF